MYLKKNNNNKGTDLKGKKKTKKRKKEEGQKILFMYVFECKNEKNGRKEMEKIMLIVPDIPPSCSQQRKKKFYI